MEGAPRAKGAARAEGAARNEGTARNEGAARNEGTARNEGAARNEDARTPAGRLRVRFFAAGHGLSVLFRTPGNHTVLVDAGRGHQKLLGDNLVRRRLAPHFRAQGIRHLDAWFITHPHFDHFGDPESLGQAVKIRRLLLNSDGELWLGAKLSRELDGVNPEVLHQGSRLQFGRLRVDVLSPAANAAPAHRTWGLDRHNNRSLVLRVTFGQVRFLLVGDLLVSGERQLLRQLARTGDAKRALAADVLQLGHHGLGSGHPAFLRRVSPRFAVASCGQSWRGQDRLPWRLGRRLARRGIQLLRTDRQGDILFSTDGVDLQAGTQPEHRLGKPHRLASRESRRSFWRRRRKPRPLHGPFGRLTYGLQVPPLPGR